MTRLIAECWAITLALEAVTPIHVGGLEDDGWSDLPLARDGLGRLYIPGTSIAGVCRSHVWDLYAKREIDRVWGAIPPRGQAQKASNEPFGASHIEFRNLVLAKVISTEVRDGVGIDPFSATSKAGLKFDREILPKGTELQIELVLSVPVRQADWLGKEMVRDLVQGFKDGTIRLGGAQTRGLGRVRLKRDPRASREVMNSRDGILNALRMRGGAAERVDAWSEFLSSYSPKTKPRIAVNLCWVPTAPLFVKSSAEGAHVDIMPLVSEVSPNQFAPVLPGSSLKGLLRHQAQRILNTVCGGKPAAQASELVEILFGDAGPAKSEEDRRAHLGRAAVSIDDVFCVKALTREQWRKLADEDTTLPQHKELARVRESVEIYVATHIAIDRWTGGVARGMLFTAAETGRLNWDDIKIDVDPARLLSAARGDVERAKAALGLLVLCLGDFANGHVPPGYGVNRGRGDLEVTDMRLEIVRGLSVSQPAVEQVLAGLLQNLNHGGERTVVNAFQDFVAGAFRNRIEKAQIPAVDV
jgi:CRISPR/Cas system CSM-associated protein Csm3 (group 7 of RAMP superfamily)